MNAVLSELIDKLSNDALLFIYGAGQYGKMIYKVMIDYGIEREVFFVETDPANKSSLMSKRIISLHEMKNFIQLDLQYEIILAVSKANENEIVDGVISNFDKERILLLSDEERRELIDYNSKRKIEDNYSLINRILNELNLIRSELTSMKSEVSQATHSIRELQKETSVVRELTSIQASVGQITSRSDKADELFLDCKKELSDTLLSVLKPIEQTVNETCLDEKTNVRSLDLLNNKLVFLDNEINHLYSNVLDNLANNKLREKAICEPEISVVVPVYNTFRYLMKCMDSILNQTFINFEVIIVDDGSTDSSLQLIQYYEQMDSRVNVICKKNTGYGDSINCGMRVARGKYVAIVESDDFVKYDMLEKLYYSAERSNADVTLSSYFILHEYSGQVEKADYLITHGNITMREEKADLLCGPSAIWRGLYNKDFLEKNAISFLATPGASYQDTSFFFKVIIMAKTVVGIAEPLLFYRRDHENASVQDQSKVYCICNEFDEIRRYLVEKDCYDAWKDIFARGLFKKYNWNYERLYGDAKKSFLDRYRKDLFNVLQDGLIDIRSWPQYEQDIVHRVLAK